MQSRIRAMNDLYHEGAPDPALPKADAELDCTGLRCPLPLLRLKQQMARLAPGAVLAMTATDSGARRDIPAWLALTRHRLLAQGEEGGQYRFLIVCGAPPETG